MPSNFNRGRMRFSPLLAILSCALSCSVSSVDAKDLRGVEPSVSGHYAGSGGSFSCLDSSAVIPVDRVNDDYCDCMDGSDEPGTSACPNGVFYCKNKGHKPGRLPSQFVDDGLCDCCDGSDEQPGLCNSTCMEQGKEYKKAIQYRIKVVEAGIKEKEARIQLAGITKENWRVELETYVDKIAKQKEVVDEIRVRKEAADQVEREEAERIAQTAPKPDLQEGECQNEDGSQSCPNQDIQEVDDTQESIPADQESIEHEMNEQMPETVLEEMHETLEEKPDVGLTGEKGLEMTEEWEPAPGGLDANAQTEIETDTQDLEVIKIESQFHREKSVTQEADGVEEIKSDAQTDDATDFNLDYESMDDDDSGVGEYVRTVGASPPSSEPDVAPSLLDRMKGLLGRVKNSVFGGDNAGQSASAPSQANLPKSPAQILAEELESAESDLRTLEEEEADLKAKLEMDYGPESEFLWLSGKCIEMQVDKYTYKACPFDGASQNEGASSVSIGRWEGFEEQYHWMKFTRGQRCWNGPERSLTVALKCGDKEEMVEMLEPNMCEYVAVMHTPSICGAGEIEVLQSDLAVIEEGQEETSAKDEL